MSLSLTTPKVSTSRACRLATFTLGLFLSLSSLCASHAAALEGTVGYLQGGTVTLEVLQTGEKQVLPQSQGTLLLALSPKNGAAVYFVGPKGAQLFGNTVPKLRGYISLPPYLEAKPLPKPLDSLEGYSLTWANDGSYFQIGETRFDPKLNQSFKASESDARASSRAGEVTAWLDQDNRIHLAGGKTKTARVIFDPKKTDFWQKLSKKVLESDPSMANDPQNWWVSGLAISPDGEALYFALNGGNGGGAAGNTQYAYYKWNTKTDRATLLERLSSSKGDGNLDGRLPELWVSPDGKKILSLGSVHSSAAENPAFVDVLDLVAGKSTFLDWEKFAKTFEQGTNQVHRPCWVNANLVALSATSYDISKFFSSNGNINLPEDPKDFTLYFFDASSGKMLGKRVGASSPACMSK